MRPLLAALLTTVLPMFVGMRWVSSDMPIVRWSLGAVLGIVLVSLGGFIGGLAGAPLIGAAGVLLISWFVGARVRWEVGGPRLPALTRRVVVLVVLVGSALMLMSLFRPVASWDGWFIWSLKSKGLALAGSFESPVFVSPTYFWSSQEYPPLLPSWQALAYDISGDLSLSWPLQFQQAWLWTAGAVALVGLTSGLGRGAFLLPFAWVATPQVVWQSMQGYADVPMALMLVLGTVVVWRHRRDPRAHIVGGILLAGAALMKAEGLPLALIVLGSLLVMRRPKWIVLAPAIVLIAWMPWLIFMQAHDITSHILNASTIASVFRGEVSPRIPEITSAIGVEMLSPIRWGFLVPACLLTAALARRFDVRLAVATLLQLALFVAIYSLSWSAVGLTLEDYMASNVDRILIAPIGLLVLAVALGGRTPAPGGRREDNGVLLR